MILLVKNYSLIITMWFDHKHVIINDVPLINMIWRENDLYGDIQP